MKINIFKIFLFFLYFLSASCFACSTVFWNTTPAYQVVARSTDLFMNDKPQLFVYPRGLEHSGEAGKNSLKWKAKYGSVVVTEFHSKAASDGMNEAGFVVHLLYLSQTKYPDVDTTKPLISNVLWAQYLLDNFKTVKEALAASETLQIIATEVGGRSWPLHLTMEDPSGNSAIIEYIDGKMKTYEGKQYQVMTNEPELSLQLSNLKKYRTFGGDLPIPGDPDPLSRYVRASFYLKTLPNANSNIESIAGVYSIIRTVMVPFGAVDTSESGTEDAWATRWITIADLKNKIYYFQSTVAPNIIWLDFSKLNFSEGQPVLSIDPSNIKLIGEVSKELKK